MAGRGKPADGPISPQNWAYSPPPVPVAFNPAEARLRLQKLAGAKLVSASGDAAKLTFTCLVFANDPRFERLASVVQKQLADVGIDMKLQPVPQKDLIHRVGAGEFDAYLFEASGRALNRVYEFWHYSDGGFNNTGYRSADEVLDRIRGTLSDDATIRKDVAALQRVLHEDPPAAFLTWPVTSRAVSRRFDVAPEPNRDILANVWQWRVAAAGQQAAR
jgi:ABC-type transport system substrate-binding protein